jgi:hypothetical protein
MTRTAGYFRAILLLRAAWNIIGAVTFFFFWKPILQRIGMEVPETPIFVWITVGFIFISGILNLLVMSRGLEYRPVLWNDIAGRAWFILVCVYFYLRGEAPAAVFVLCSGDATMIALGVDFLRHYPKLETKIGPLGARRSGTV